MKLREAARVEINAVSMWIPMRCHSVGCGTLNQMQ
jgi:hypothetical protein